MIFEYSDYKKYLRAWIENEGGRGTRSRLAERMHCHTGYVSQVLNGGAHLSAEQAEEFNLFAGLSREEGEFFHLLVQHARAATPALRARIDAQIKSARDKRLVLRNRAHVERSLRESDQTTYYGSWVYAAVHVLLTIPAFRTEEAIRKKLGLSRQRTRDAIRFLLRAGLAMKEKGALRPGVSRLFLRSDSPMIQRHHTNWRLRAIDSLERAGESDLHLSTVLSLSQADVARIKERLIKVIEEVRETSRHSAEEEIHCFCLDFFAVGKS